MYFGDTLLWQVQDKNALCLQSAGSYRIGNSAHVPRDTHEQRPAFECGDMS